MILSNGYKYSHSEKYQNFKEIPNLDLQKDDIVSLKYDDGYLTFSDGKKYQYLRIPEVKDDEYHFGVYLYELGDSVSILKRN